MEAPWIDWSGERNPPVARNEQVEIQFRDGNTLICQNYWGPWGGDHQNAWYHNGGNCDIVRYRLTTGDAQ